MSMKNFDLHRNIVAQLAGTRQTLLQFYAAHDIIKKVSPETRLAIHRTEAFSMRSPLNQVYYTVKYPTAKAEGLWEWGRGQLYPRKRWGFERSYTKRSPARGCPVKQMAIPP
jgi:hypothetical protein